MSTDARFKSSLFPADHAQHIGDYLSHEWPKHVLVAIYPVWDKLLVLTSKPILSRLDGGEVEQLVRMLSDASTSSETPGVAQDRGLDAIIQHCREWVSDEEERADREAY